MSKKALIVDDEKALSEIIVEVLKTMNIISYPAYSGDEAIKIAENHEQIDLFVIDINMPGMNGYETYDGLKVNHPATALLFISGYDLADELGEMKLSCPNLFLQKPFTINELAKTVSTLLR